MTPHTPTPWTVHQVETYQIHGQFINGESKCLGKIREEADAAFIVCAVNSHEALIAVLNEAKHFASTGKGKEFLQKAIAKAEAQ